MPENTCVHEDLQDSLQDNKDLQDNKVIQFTISDNVANIRICFPDLFFCKCI